MAETDDSEEKSKEEGIGKEEKIGSEKPKELRERSKNGDA